MTEVDDMLNEIDTALGSLPSNYVSGPSNDYDIFEGYVFALLLEEAQNVGARVRYTDNSGSTPPPICTFRTDPSSITSDDPYTYAVIDFPRRNKPSLEAHIGVFVTGKSRVRHECDVLLLLRTEAEACRRSHQANSRIVLPRSSKVVLAVECKYYDLELGVNLGRSFIGLISDLGVKNAFFVTNKASSSPAKLLMKQGKRLSWQPRIYPNPFDANDVDRLRGLFKDVFKNYFEN